MHNNRGLWSLLFYIETELMKEHFVKLGEWIQEQLKVYGVWLFWGAFGSAFAVLWPRNKKLKAVIPIWHYIVKFLVGVVTTLAGGDYFAQKSGFPPALAGFILGICAYGFCGFLIRSSKNPVKLYKDIKTLREDKDDDSE